MSRRKDRERFLQLKQQNPGYLGFRSGSTAVEAAPAPELASVLCSVCGRKRNVPVESVAGAGEDFICIRCQNQPDQDLSSQDNPGSNEQNP